MTKDAPSKQGQNLNFKDLLQRSTQLLADVETADAPQINKSLESIHEQSRKLALKNTRSTDAQSKGDLLMAQRGFNVEKYRRALNAIDLKAAFEPLEPLRETDIDGYLRHEHNMILLSAVEEAKKLTSNHFYKNYDNYLDQDWRSAKIELVRILDLNHGSEKNGQSVVVSNYQTKPYLQSGLKPNSHTPGRQGMTKLDFPMSGYAGAVARFNHASSGQEFYPIIREFMRCARELDQPEMKRRNILSCWEIIRQMVDEEELETTGVLDPHYEFSKEKLIHGALKCLERQYDNHLRVALQQRSAQYEYAETKDVVREYVKSEFNKLGDARNTCQVYNDVPIWMELYYLLRCGDYSTAYDRASEYAGISSQFVQEDVVNQLKILKELGVSNIGGELRQSQRNGTEKMETYKELVMVFINRIRSEKKGYKPIDTAEDWIWFHLGLARSNPAYLNDLAATVNKYGPQHFSAKRDSLLFFKLLLLTQQFEKAIEYLCGRDMDDFQLEATHYAIALNRYGLLHTNPELSDPLIKTVNNTIRINFAFLVLDYTRIFSATDQHIAAEYFALFLPNQGAVFKRFILQTIVEARDPSVLLGTVDSKCARQSGYLERLLQDQQILEIVDCSAREYENMGLSSVAIELYFLAFAYNEDAKTDTHKSREYLKSVLRIVNNELSRVMIEGNDDRDQVISTAINKVQERFNQGSLHTRLRQEDREYSTFITLLELTKFFNMVRDSQWKQAIDVMQRLQIVPLTVDSATTLAVRRYRTTDDAVRLRISEIIDATMTAIYKNYLEEKQRGNRSALGALKDKSNALLTFAGMIQESVSREVYARLMRMDQLIIQ